MEKPTTCTITGKKNYNAKPTHTGNMGQVKTTARREQRKDHDETNYSAHLPQGNNSQTIARTFKGKPVSKRRRPIGDQRLCCMERRTSVPPRERRPTYGRPRRRNKERHAIIQKIKGGPQHVDAFGKRTLLQRKR